MKVSTLEAVARALASNDVAYLVAGGVAVNAHGHQRLTHDLDLVLQLAPENVRRALGALGELGYAPVLPVAAQAFADPERRKEWISEKNMEVFSLVSDDHRDTTIDLFVTEPFDFEEEHRRALVSEIAAGVEMRFVRLDTLIAMKEATERALDQDDARHLRWIAQERDQARASDEDEEADGD
ncbi:MAG: hypothetical protein ACODAA_09535 [Gemmatimonadota bacterium]